MQKKNKIAIIGGGASGIMCAARLTAKKCNAEIKIFEKNDRILKKINITGNGRCNLSNERASKRGYYYNNDRFVIPINQKYDDKFISNEFLRLGMATVKDSEGRYYPESDDAKSVVACLTNAIQGKAEVLTDTPIENIKKIKSGFLINNEYFDILILSVGGASTEKLGCCGDCIKLGSLLGYKTVPLMPSLTGMKSTDCEKSLAGVRQNANAYLLKNNMPIAFEYGQIQFNNGILSGIAIMNLSRYVDDKNDYSIYLEFKKKDEVFRFLKKCPTQITAGDAMLGLLKRPLGNYILKKASVKKDTPLFMLSDEKLTDISNLIENLEFKIQGVRDFEFSQVSRGGLDLNEFYKDSLASKKDKNFYCIGEALDVDGACGGFNLHFAFASACLAADSICKELND